MKSAINRNNYEEFFMLYADRELSAADMQAVERFVAENPDLADELELYLQTQLPIEDISFTDKEILYRPEAGDITADNLEERFLLYVDNELDAVSREKVERFVLQNPVHQEAFTLLKQTKLLVETIVFADKASLYRKEERKPVVFTSWTRMAAAAAFIGLAILVWTLIPAGNSNPGFAKLNTGVGTPAESGKTNPVERQTADAPSTVTAMQQTGVLHPQGKLVTTPGVQQEAANAKAIVPQDNAIAYNTVTPPVENRDAVNSGIIAGTNETAVSADRVPAGGGSQQNTEVKTAMVQHDDNTQDAKNYYAHAVYKELDTDDEKKSLYLGSLEINKDKLRGFFRKAGSLFRSKAKQEEENKTETVATDGTRSLK